MDRNKHIANAVAEFVRIKQINANENLRIDYRIISEIVYFKQSLEILRKYYKFIS